MSRHDPQTLTACAVEIMATAEPGAKVEMTRRTAAAWRAGDLVRIGDAHPPARPARPAQPELKSPGDMPRRRKGGLSGRQAFVHAIAHIELNAIDLAWDIVARFTDENLPKAFFDDWVGVALDEAEHFTMLAKRLRDLGISYGDLPAHDGLWEAAERTADDLLARLALVPMVLEARGLDTTPKAVEGLKRAGDEETARVLTIIGHEEIPHVAAGVRWFEYLCARHGIPPHETFHALVTARFSGTLKPPFNRELRDAAGMNIGYYQPLSESTSDSSSPAPEIDTRRKAPVHEQAH